MSEVEPIKFGIGVSGWKARQNRARQKMVRAKSPEEREAIRLARAKLYEEQALQAEKESEAGEPVQEVTGDTVTDEVEMTREEMIKTLKDAGQTVGPNTKDETLAKRVEALYEAETETPDSAA